MEYSKGCPKCRLAYFWEGVPDPADVYCPKCRGRLRNVPMEEPCSLAPGKPLTKTDAQQANARGAASYDQQIGAD